MKKHILTLSLCCGLLSFGLNAQTKELKVNNKSANTVVDYTLEVPAASLKLPLGTYIGVFEDGTSVPVEITNNIYDEQIAVIPIAKLDAKENKAIKIKQGSHATYPKKTYAELSHKIGGEFNGNKYEGGFSWVKPNQMTLPGSFRDHAYYIKYEGPGWENDKVAFRFYLDNRNAIDVFGKKTSGIVLPTVGADNYKNYHDISFWGADNLFVGKALGLGTIASWDGKKARRVDTKDSVTCIITADGKVRSQIKTMYYGWQPTEDTKYDLTSLITIDAGNRASHMELLTDKSIPSIATGIIKLPDTELIVSNDKGSEWSYIATFGPQSFFKDMQGLAIFARTKQVAEVTEDDLNHILVLTPENNYVEYYFMPTWEQDNEPVVTREDFVKCLDEALNRLNSEIAVKY